MNKYEWDVVCNYILKDAECKHLHKMVWREAGEIYITIGTERTKITTSWTVDKVKRFVQTGKAPA